MFKMNEGVLTIKWQDLKKLGSKHPNWTHLIIARNFLTTTMIKNTQRAGITAAAGTRLTHALIRSVIYTVINYPISRKSPSNPQNKE